MVNFTTILRRTVAPGLVGLALLTALPWTATASPQRTLYTCQTTVARQSKKYIAAVAKAFEICLLKASKLAINSNNSVTGAADTCARALAGLAGTGTTLPPRETMTESILDKCDPSSPGVEHTLGDLLGSGAGVSQPISAGNLARWCTGFGGDGSLDSAAEWVDCITTAQECNLWGSLAGRYPRALEWFEQILPVMQNIAPLPIDAIDTLLEADQALEGPGNDNIPNLRCGPSSLPASGQLVSFAPGDDGQRRTGMPLAYLDNHNGTITDLNTGLTWEKKVGMDGMPNGNDLHDADNVYPWIEAFNFVALLNANNFAGRSDWRVPNIKELETLVDYGAGIPTTRPEFHGVNCGPLCTDLTDSNCSCTSYASLYWSSTSTEGPKYGKEVSFYDGSSLGFLKSVPFHVRAVYGGK